MTEVSRIAAYALNDHAFEVLEDSLEPFIMTNAVSSIAQLARCAEDGLYYVCNSDELEHVYAEVSVVTDGNIHAPTYYGGDTYLAADLSRSSLSSSRSVFVPDTHHASPTLPQDVPSTSGSKSKADKAVSGGVYPSPHTSTLHDAGGRVVATSSSFSDTKGRAEGATSAKTNETAITVDDKHDNSSNKSTHSEKASHVSSSSIPGSNHSPDDPADGRIDTTAAGRPVATGKLNDRVVDRSLHARQGPMGHSEDAAASAGHTREDQRTTTSFAGSSTPVSPSADMSMPAVLSSAHIAASPVAAVPLLRHDASSKESDLSSQRGDDMAKTIEEQLAQLRPFDAALTKTAVPSRLHGGVEIIDDVLQRSEKVLSLRANALHRVRHNSGNNLSTTDFSGLAGKNNNNSSSSSTHTSQLAAPHLDSPPSPEDGSMGTLISTPVDATSTLRPLITIKDAWYILQIRRRQRDSTAELCLSPLYHPLKAHTPPPPASPPHTPRNSSHADDTPGSGPAVAQDVNGTGSKNSNDDGKNNYDIDGGIKNKYSPSYNSVHAKVVAKNTEATEAVSAAATNQWSALTEWNALAVMIHLLNEPGALYVKTPLATCRTFLDNLHIDQLFFPANMGYYSAVMEPLLLRPSTYFMWAMLSERGAGTRTHVGPMGSHALHILLRGRKRWIVAHPLDKQLLTDPESGQPADLANINHTAYPHARHARLFTFVQDAGEAVFVPCDALHCEMSEEDSTALLVQFMDASNAYMHEKHSVINSLAEESTKKLNLLSSKLVPYTTIDLILFDHNVYPSFRGNNRPYQPYAAQTVIVLRAILQLEQVWLPCDELGARVNLDALQFCFGLLGQALLHRSGGSAGSADPFYVVGVPKGFLVSRSDSHLSLYYFVEPPSFAAIRECLHTKADEVCVDMQYFERQNVTLPVITYFRSTSSHRGYILDYVPLSVLFNQRWPFEQDLVRNLVSVPSIILSKTHHTQGFIRPGSVWHYSRFQLHRFGSVEHGSDLHSALETDCEEMWRNVYNTSMALEYDRVSDGTAANHTDSKDVAISSTGNTGTTDDVNDRPGRTPSAATTKHAQLGGTVDSIYSAARQWCRTFLFYCCPVLNKPILLYPLQSGPALQNPESVSCVGKELPFQPQIVELEWNIHNLQEYGVAQLIQLDDDCDAEIKSTVVDHPSFAAFQKFTDEHGLVKPDQAGSTQMELIMPAVMWFLCTQGVVGYVCQEEQYAQHEGAPKRDKRVHAETQPRDEEEEKKPAETVSGTASSAAHRDGAAADDKDDFTLKNPPVQQETVCLTACAASVFLSCVTNSTYALLVTRLCNWLCNIAEEATPEREESLFLLVKETLQSSHEEAKAIIFQVIDIKTHSVNACVDCKQSSQNSPDGAPTAALTTEVAPAQPTTTQSGGEDAPCCSVDGPKDHNSYPVHKNSAGLVNKDKLARLEKFCRDIQQEKTVVTDAQAKAE